MGGSSATRASTSSTTPSSRRWRLYETYGDYDTMRVLTQELIQEAATAVYGSPVARRADADGTVVEYDLVRRLAGQDDLRGRLGGARRGDHRRHAAGGAAAARRRDRARRSTPDAGPGPSCSRRSTSELVREHDRRPRLLHRLPQGERPPLTRQHRDDPRLAEKWDLVIFGAEQGTAYSELIDPLDQRERLVAQSLLAAGRRPRGHAGRRGLPRRALEYGMPPTGGMGMGIDRLVMNLTGLSIRDTILFPRARPRSALSRSLRAWT